MKLRWYALLGLLAGLFGFYAYAQFPLPSPTWRPNDTRGNAGRILDMVHGSIITECSRDTDADTNTNNRLGPFEANRKYMVYCHDGAGAGVACECLQGTSSVDNSAGGTEGIVLFANEKMIFTFQSGFLYISCVPYVDNQQYDVCPLDY